MTLLVFSFINSFIIKNKKISIDVEIFIFQAASVFYLELRANFKWREEPERIFDNYGYVKVLFILVFILTFIYLCIRNENKLLKKYVYSIFFILVIIEIIFEIGIIYTISLLFYCTCGFTLSFVFLFLSLIFANAKVCKFKIIKIKISKNKELLGFFSAALFSYWLHLGIYLIL